MTIQKTFQARSHTDLPLFIQWMDFLKWLLLATEKFPKRVRFTFSDRMNTLALNIVEDLVEARYTKTKEVILRRINVLRLIYRSKQSHSNPVKSEVS